MSLCGDAESWHLSTDDEQIFWSSRSRLLNRGRGRQEQVGWMESNTSSVAVSVALKTPGQVTDEPTQTRPVKSGKTRKPTLTSKCACAVMLIEKEGA
jgi:hypothetical protein